MQQIYMNASSHRIIFTKHKKGSIGIDIYEDDAPYPRGEPFYVSKKEAKLIAYALLNVCNDDFPTEIPKNEDVYAWLNDEQVREG